MNLKSTHNRSGFTIVELLIVIVIIAILATIVVVSYNGIQTSARQAQLISHVDSYEKAIEAHNIINTTYPFNDEPDVSNEDESDTTVFNCLGTTYPANQDFREGECLVQIQEVTDLNGEQRTYRYSNATSSSLNEALSLAVSSPLPRLDSNPVKTTVNTTFSDGVKLKFTLISRGLTYYIQSSHIDNLTGTRTALAVQISYYGPGDQKCGRGEKNFTAATPIDEANQNEFATLIDNSLTSCSLQLGTVTQLDDL